MYLQLVCSKSSIIIVDYGNIQQTIEISGFILQGDTWLCDFGSQVRERTCGVAAVRGCLLLLTMEAGYSESQDAPVGEVGVARIPRDRNVLIKHHFTPLG